MHLDVPLSVKQLDWLDRLEALELRMKRIVQEVFPNETTDPTEGPPGPTIKS